jgi:hypothetical protein
MYFSGKKTNTYLPAYVPDRIVLLGFDVAWICVPSK